MAEANNAPSIDSTASIKCSRTEQSGTLKISAALVNRIVNIDTTELSEDSRTLLVTMETNLVASYDSLIRKAKSQLSLPLLESNSDCRGWIVQERRVQRYWDLNHNNPLTRDDLESDFLGKFLLGTKMTSDSYRATIVDQSNQFWIIRVEGLPDSVRIICATIDRWLNYKINHHNFKLTMKKGESVNIKFDPRKPLGANLVQVRHHDCPLGLLIQAKEQPTSQFAQAIGVRNYVCAMIDQVKKAGDAPMTTFKFKELVEVAKQSGTWMDFTVKCLPAKDSGLLWQRDYCITIKAAAICKGSRINNVLFTSPGDQSSAISTGTYAHILQEDHVERAKQRDVKNNVAFGEHGYEPAGGAHLLKKDSVGSPHTHHSFEVNTGNQCHGDNGDYITFYDKLSGLVEQEFRDGGNIHKNAAMGILWMRHKKLFGLGCSEICPCVQNLCQLTETVVTDMLCKKQSKWDNPMNLKPGEYPIGIAGNFASTFLPLLTQERPSEGATRLLERLLNMWQIHQKQRIFGLKCKQGCLCFQGWEIAFRRGALPGENKPQVKLFEVCNNETIGPVPKKRKAMHHSMDQAIDKESDFQADAGQYGPLVGSVCQSDHFNSVSRQSYEIAFDCCQPLGFYCVTETKPRKYCKVISVCPYKKNMDPRIQADTEVLCTSAGQKSVKLPVHTHHDLKSRYKEAQRQGSLLFITFTNDGLPEADILKYKASFFPKEWKRDDLLWIGKCRTGFDGGAFREHGYSNDSALLKHRSIPQHSHVKTYSIRDKVKSKKVHFAEDVECRSYAIGSFPPEFLEMKKIFCKTSITETKDTPLRENSVEHQDFNIKEDANFAATSNLCDFLKWLECDGGLETYSLDQLNTLFAHLKERSQRQQSSSIQSKSLFDLKYALLKIHVNAAHAIQLCKSLKTWTRLHIFVEKIDSMQLQDIHLQPSTTIACDVIFIGEGRATEPLRPLPAEPMFINSTGQLELVYADTTPPYQVNYNPVMTKSHAIEIRLNISNQIDSNLVHLGVIRFDLAEIYQHCRGNRAHQNLNFWASTHNHLKTARLCLKARSDPLNHSHFMEKQKKCSKLMKNVIEWTARFQKDLAAYNAKQKCNLLSLGIDLKIGNTGITLLHAAIYLRDIGFVSQLLTLGAKNSLGSALTFAVNMADCFEKKKAPVVDSGNNIAKDDMDMSDASLETHAVGSSKNYDKIVQLLHEYRNSALATLKADDRPEPNQTIPHHYDFALVTPHSGEMKVINASAENVFHSTNTGQTPAKKCVPTLATQFLGRNSLYPPETKLDDGVKLPMVTDPDWLPRVRRCKFWSTNGRCRRGMTCSFVHKYNHWGNELEVIWKDMKGCRLSFDQSEFDRCVHFLTETIDGIVWYTAGFANTTAHKNTIPGILVYSEGGNARISTQGISWYESQEESYDALKRAFMASLWAAMQNGTVSTYDPINGNIHAPPQERIPSKLYRDSWQHQNDG